MRSTSSNCYSRVMGTQGLHEQVLGPRGAVRLYRARQAVIVTSLAVLPALAGCSSFSSSSSPAAQTAAVAPPPNVAMAAPAAQPAPDAGVVISPYPRQSLVELFSEPDDSPPPVQYVPRPPSTYTPAGQPYPTNQPAYGAPVAAAPPPVDNTPNLSPYPKQSLVDLFRDSDSPPPAQNVPRPPSTYTPSGQPYAANAPAYNPPAYNAPPAPAPAPPPAAAPANSEPVASVYPQQSLIDIFSSK